LAQTSFILSLPMNRRSFLHSTALAAAGSAVSNALAAPAQTMIGMDHFAVRAAGMKAPALIDYAASLKLDCIFLSELGPFESFEDAYLQKLKVQADAAGLNVFTGGMSICSSSNTWKDTWGSPEEHLALLIRMAKILGSPVARCILGNAKDRTTDGGITRHIDACVKALQSVKGRCEAEGVKIAIENHAGDMQSEELRGLIEAAGKGHVGANIDPGNAVWALEHPLHNLEVLAPYIVCSSIRDSAVWETPDGAMIQWTAVGEGSVDFKAYVKRYAEVAPTAPLNVETISGFAKPFPFLKDEFWKPYGAAPAASFAGWLGLMKNGKAIEPYKAPDKEAEAKYQKGELERSIAWLRTNSAQS
jgi:3-oxoisoapionate decarboxylase